MLVQAKLQLLPRILSAVFLAMTCAPGRDLEDLWPQAPHHRVPPAAGCGGTVDPRMEGDIMVMLCEELRRSLWKRSLQPLPVLHALYVLEMFPSSQSKHSLLQKDNLFLHVYVSADNVKWSPPYESFM